MVKKMKSSSTASGSTGRSGSADLAASVKESAQQIWLAGMGAFAKAQEEGTKVFAELVKEGKHLQAKTQGMAEDKIGEVTGRMTAMADTMQSKAGQNWDKLEGLFEQRTAKAMGKLGVPTAKEVKALSRRIDALEAAIGSTAKAAAERSRDAVASKGKRAAATGDPSGTTTQQSTRKSAPKSLTKSATKSTVKSAARKATVTAAKSAGKTAGKPIRKRGKTGASGAV